jgi:hypothetical protein
MTKELKFNVTRWIIFALLAIAMLVPLLIAEKMKLPDPKPFQVVKNIYDKIESLPEGSPVILSIDFDPGSAGELRPMTLAVLRHCFGRNLRVVGMTLWGPAAAPLMGKMFTQAANEYNKKDGVDYGLVPFKPGFGTILLLISQDFFGAYPKDHKGNNSRELAVFKGIKSLKDFSFAMDISAGNAVDAWIVYGKEKGKMPLAAGCTAVMATDYYPFLQSKQLLGLMGGLNAPFQYEALINTPDEARVAREGMKAQTVIHCFLIVLIIIGNIIYFVNKRKVKQIA